MEKQQSSAMSLKLKIAASPFQAICDSLLDLATTVCGTDYAIISLKDSCAHLFVSTVGFSGIQEIALNDSFCRHSVPNELIEIEDAQADDRFWDNPYVKGEPNIRFYAGVPITMPLGEQIGTICVFGQTPKLLDSHQKDALLGISKVLFNTIIAQEFVLKQLANLPSTDFIQE